MISRLYFPAARIPCCTSISHQGSGNLWQVVQLSTQSDQQHGSNPSLWRQFVTTIKTFGQGAKLLVNDIRKMREIKSAMGGFTLRGAIPMAKPNNAVQLEHVQFMYKTSADLKRTLPALLLFCIPLVGYVAPFIALMFPDKLLSSHFWSESQKKELTEKSLRRRQDSVLKLSSLRKHPSDYNSSNFEEISAVDLQLLLRSWGVSDPIIPLKLFRVAKLRKHLHYIHSCDWILSRDGLEHFKMETKNNLIIERLPLYSINDDNNQDLILRKWLETQPLKDEEGFNEVVLAHMVTSVTPREQPSG